MFSKDQKRQISEAIQKILRDTNHPELPKTEIQFTIHVKGAEGWSWADISNNGAVTNPGINAWNEAQAARSNIKKLGDAAIAKINSMTKEELRAKFIEHGYDPEGETNEHNT